MFTKTMICINISKTIFSIVFLEHAGELRIFVLREEKSPITFPSPYLGLE